MNKCNCQCYRRQLGFCLLVFTALIKMAFHSEKLMSVTVLHYLILQGVKNVAFEYVTSV